MRTLIALPLALVGALGPAACAGGADPAPSVTILEVSPEELDPAVDEADDLTIRLGYRDGDADLGGGLAEIQDCRAADLLTALELPAIASMAAVEEGVPIEGELTLTVADVGIAAGDATAPAPCELLPEPATTTFCVVLVDAAGHRGGADCTPAITLR